MIRHDLNLSAFGGEEARGTLLSGNIAVSHPRTVPIAVSNPHGAVDHFGATLQKSAAMDAGTAANAILLLVSVGVVLALIRAQRELVRLRRVRDRYRTFLGACSFKGFGPDAS